MEEILDAPERPNTNFFVYLWNYKSWVFTVTNIITGVSLMGISIHEPGHPLLLIPAGTMLLNWLGFYFGYETWRANEILDYELGFKEKDEVDVIL